MDRNRQAVKPDSNIKKIVDLNLGEEKVNVMKDSIFGSLSSIVNKRESSSTLVEVLARYYNTSKKIFELPNGIHFSFCRKEVAHIIGMEDMGADINDLLKQCSRSSSTFPSMSKAKDLKKKLTEMSVEDEESKKCFKKLMSYFLVEQVLLCARDAKKVRKLYWPVVENDESRETCNWAKATWDHMHISLGDLKRWYETKASGQHSYIGAAPVLETIIYERIEKMRPGVFPIDKPPIQKYTSKRQTTNYWESKFNQLTSDDVAVCLHCTTCSSEETPAISKDDPSVTQKFGSLSLTPMGDSEDVSESNLVLKLLGRGHSADVAGSADASGSADVAASASASASVAASASASVAGSGSTDEEFEDKMKELEGVCNQIIASTDVSVEDETSASVENEANRKTRAGRVIKQRVLYSPPVAERKKAKPKAKAKAKTK